MKRNKQDYMPDLIEVQKEIQRLRSKRRARRIFWDTLGILASVIAIALLVAVLPIYEVTGSGMEPTLQSGDIVLCWKTDALQSGDVYCFSGENRMILKRVIALGGSRVEVAEDGTVRVDDATLQEPYLTQKDRGDGDVQYPLEVPDGTVFVLGDARAKSVDSRYSQMGCLRKKPAWGR